MPKWGGVRPHSGRPKGGVSDARRRIIAAFHSGGVDECAQVVDALVLEGEGAAVLKIWHEMGAHVPEKQAKKKKDSLYALALKISASNNKSP